MRVCAFGVLFFFFAFIRLHLLRNLETNFDVNFEFWPLKIHSDRSFVSVADFRLYGAYIRHPINLWPLLNITQCHFMQRAQKLRTNESKKNKPKVMQSPFRSLALLIVLSFEYYLTTTMTHTVHTVRLCLCLCLCSCLWVLKTIQNVVIWSFAIIFINELYKLRYTIAV